VIIISRKREREREREIEIEIEREFLFAPRFNRHAWHTAAVAIFRLWMLIILQVVEGQNQQDLHISFNFLDRVNLDEDFVN